VSDQEQAQGGDIKAGTGESAANPVPSPAANNKLSPEEIVKILKSSLNSAEQKRIRAARAIVPDRPMRYKLDDGTVFLLRAQKHSEQREFELSFLDLKEIVSDEQHSKELLGKMLELFERLAKARIIGWENFRDYEDNPVEFEKSTGGPFPLTEDSLEMIDLALLRQIGMDIFNRSRPDAETVGK
jgi:hypothetical protein